MPSWAVHFAEHDTTRYIAPRTLRRWVIPKSVSTVHFWKMGRTPFLTHVALHEQDDLRVDAWNIQIRFGLQGV